MGCILADVSSRLGFDPNAAHVFGPGNSFIDVDTFVKVSDVSAQKSGAGQPFAANLAPMFEGTFLVSVLFVLVQVALFGEGLRAPGAVEGLVEVLQVDSHPHRRREQDVADETGEGVLDAVLNFEVVFHAHFSREVLATKAAVEAFLLLSPIRFRKRCRLVVAGHRFQVGLLRRRDGWRRKTLGFRFRRLIRRISGDVVCSSRSCWIAALDFFHFLVRDGTTWK